MVDHLVILNVIILFRHTNDNISVNDLWNHGYWAGQTKIQARGKRN